MGRIDFHISDAPIQFLNRVLSVDLSFDDTPKIKEFNAFTITQDSDSITFFIPIGKELEFVEGTTQALVDESYLKLNNIICDHETTIYKQEAENHDLKCKLSFYEERGNE